MIHTYTHIYNYSLAKIITFSGTVIDVIMVMYIAIWLTATYLKTRVHTQSPISAKQTTID